MNVAVPEAQHSPMFGQRASSQTVCRWRSRRIFSSVATTGPDGIGTLSQSGFGPGVMRRVGREDIWAGPGRAESRDPVRATPIRYGTTGQALATEPPDCPNGHRGVGPIVPLVRVLPAPRPGRSAG